MMLMVAQASAEPTAKIAYVAEGRIWTVSPDGSELARLKPTGRADFAPTFSHSRGTIAFINARKIRLLRQRHLMMMRADGSHRRTIRYAGPSLVSGTMALAYSPDGRRIAGASSMRDGSVYAVTILNLKTRRSRVLHRIQCEGGVRSLSWSPDGRQLLVTVEYGGGYGLFRYATRSGESLTTPRLNAQSAAWHPTDEVLLCSVWIPEEATLLVSPEGTILATLGPQVYALAYSPDGTRYAYAGLDGVGTASAADGGDVRSLATRGGSIWSLTWK